MIIPDWYLVYIANDYVWVQGWLFDIVRWEATSVKNEILILFWSLVVNVLN